jgi:hypothetical protein
MKNSLAPKKTQAPKRIAGTKESDGNIGNGGELHQIAGGSHPSLAASRSSTQTL